MSGFQRPLKKTVDPAALERFASGADERREAINGPQVSPPLAVSFSPTREREGVAELTVSRRETAKTALKEKKTESLLYRLTASEQADIQFVFENTNVKSQQKLLESIIQPEIARRAALIRKGSSS